MTDTVITVRQAARLLRVSDSTLRRLYTDYGRLPPPIRLSPGRIGYRLSTIENYLAEQEAAS